MHGAATPDWSSGAMVAGGAGGGAFILSSAKVECFIPMLRYGFPSGRTKGSHLPSLLFTSQPGSCGKGTISHALDGDASQHKCLVNHQLFIHLELSSCFVRMALLLLLIHAIGTQLQPTSSKPLKQNLEWHNSKCESVDKAAGIQQMISIVYMSYKECTINKCLPVPVSLVYPNYKRVASSCSSPTYVALCNQAKIHPLSQRTAN